MGRTILLGTLVGALATSISQAGTLEFAAASYAVSENASTFDVLINRSGNLSDPATITVKSSDGSAMVTEDYQNMSIVLNWASGEASAKPVTVTIIDDNTVEATEEFQLSLINPVGDTVGAQGIVTVSISDYEEGRIEFSSASVPVTENQASVLLNVNRVQGTDGDVTIDYETKDSLAVKQQDYIEMEGTLTFLDGENSKTIEVPIVNDEFGEIEQSFTVELSSVSGGALIGTIASTSIVITDDDPDFTPVLTKLSADIQDTSQIDAIDLNQAALIDSSKSLLDTINEIAVLSATELVASQNTNGEVSIVVGDDLYFLRPIEVLRAASSVETAIFLNPDSSGLFRTADGIDIHFQPALAGLTVFQSELAVMELPEIEVNEYGNITIQADQGPPPLEQNEEGKLVINNSFYDRFNLRPSSIAMPSSESQEGISLVNHPRLIDENLLAVIFNYDSAMREQLLSSAPIISTELTEALAAIEGFESIEVKEHGIVEFSIVQDRFMLFPDYIIRRVEEFAPGDIGITGAGDLNTDGFEDFLMTYSSGDEQYFLVLPLN